MYMNMYVLLFGFRMSSPADMIVTTECLFGWSTLSPTTPSLIPSLWRRASSKPTGASATWPRQWGVPSNICTETRVTRGTTGVTSGQRWHKPSKVNRVSSATNLSTSLSLVTSMVMWGSFYQVSIFHRIFLTIARACHFSIVWPTLTLSIISLSQSLYNSWLVIKFW